jgi:hypothetical protein
LAATAGDAIPGLQNAAPGERRARRAGMDELPIYFVKHHNRAVERELPNYFVNFHNRAVEGELPNYLVNLMCNLFYFL